jgi:prepilin-type N-terminal cleavage/methylation domain-containing protein
MMMAVDGIREGYCDGGRVWRILEIGIDGLGVSRLGYQVRLTKTSPTIFFMKKTKRLFGFTLIELLVVISIIAILAALALPAITGALGRGQLTQTMSNARQIFIASTQMALDGTTTGDTNLGWPGDVNGGDNTTWEPWANALVPAYMPEADFAKMLSAPGLIRGTNVAAGTATPSALTVYAVTDSSPMAMAFITTANYTNGTELSASAKPYGDKGFVVFKKGGDGAIFLKNQATNTDLLPTDDFTNALQ